MAGGLRKVSGAPPEWGLYAVSGTLEGVVPGRRVVKRLGVRRLTEASVGGLGPLTAFGQLEELTLEHIREVDLTPLTELEAELGSLDLRNLVGVDLAPLQRLGPIRDLALWDLADSCDVPVRLPLPASLRHLAIVNDDRRVTGEPVRRLIEAIRWQDLKELKRLSLRVGGNESIDPVEVDLGFLRWLPKLTRLDLEQGVSHKGSGPSPLEPPFAGLSRNLTWLRIDAWEPDPLKRALYAYLPEGAHVSVYQRYGPQPRAASWVILDPEEDGDPWHTYGSFADLYDAEHDVPTEHDGLKIARRRLGETDPKLLGRLDFDPESSGTGVAAHSREDLEAMLDILGIASA